MFKSFLFKNLLCVNLCILLFALLFSSFGFNCKIAVIANPDGNITGGNIWVLSYPDQAGCSEAPLSKITIPYWCGKEGMRISYSFQDILYSLNGNGELKHYNGSVWVCDGWLKTANNVIDIRDFDAYETHAKRAVAISGDKFYRYSPGTQLFFCEHSYPGLNLTANDPFGGTFITAEDGSFWEYDVDGNLYQYESLPMRPIDLMYDPANYRVTAIVTNGAQNFYCYFDGDIWSLHSYAGSNMIIDFNEMYQLHAWPGGFQVISQITGSGVCYQVPQEPPEGQDCGGRPVYGPIFHACISRWTGVP